MTGRTAQIHQAAFGQQDDLFAVRKFNLINLGLDIVPFHVAQGFDLNFAVEVTDIADNRPVLHGAHMVNSDDIHIARRGDENIAP